MSIVLLVTRLAASALTEAKPESTAEEGLCWGRAGDAPLLHLSGVSFENLGREEMGLPTQPLTVGHQFGVV